MSKLSRALAISAATTAALATFALPASAQQATFEADLAQQNASGDSGSATVTVDGNQATVQVTTTGVSGDVPHAQHLHIGGENVCPDASADSDGDGFVSTPEGQPAYGGIKVSLTTSGDVGPESGLAVDRFPVATGFGSINYERSFELPGDVTADDLANAVVVQHGIAESSLGEDPATYDGPDSPLMEGVPQEATLPASCGTLTVAAETGAAAAVPQAEQTPTGGVQTGGGGTATDSSLPLAATAAAGLGLAGALILRRRVATATNDTR